MFKFIDKHITVGVWKLIFSDQRPHQLHSLRWFAFSVRNSRVDHPPTATAAGAHPTRDDHAEGDGKGYPNKAEEEKAAGSCLIGCLVCGECPFLEEADEVEKGYPFCLLALDGEYGMTMKNHRQIHKQSLDQSTEVV